MYKEDLALQGLICHKAQLNQTFNFFMFLMFHCSFIFNDHTIPSGCGGARGVVVIAVGNEHGDTSSNPGRN